MTRRGCRKGRRPLTKIGDIHAPFSNSFAPRAKGGQTHTSKSSFSCLSPLSSGCSSTRSAFPQSKGSGKTLSTVSERSGDRPTAREYRARHSETWRPLEPLARLSKLAQSAARRRMRPIGCGILRAALVLLALACPCVEAARMSTDALAAESAAADIARRPPPQQALRSTSALSSRKLIRELQAQAQTCPGKRRRWSHTSIDS